jgi:hypothetical protein
MHLAEFRPLIASRREGVQKKGELKNETFIRDVIENTRRKNAGISAPRMCMKANTLGGQGQDVDEKTGR